jgi:hypothetical protein
MNIRLSFSGACAFSLITALTGAAPGSVTESEPQPQQVCPQVTVSCPSSFEDGEAITFTASVVGGNPSVVPTYNWMITAGRIIEGQGTSSIKVETLGFGRSFTATVNVSGFDQSCAKTASCSILPGAPAPPAVLFDRYYPKSNFTTAPKKPRSRRKFIRRH